MHLIDQSRVANGAVMYAKVPAWTKLGIVTNDVFTWSDFVDQIGDFKVCRRKLDFLDENGFRIHGKDNILYRSDTGFVLGIVQDNYHVLQNKDVAACMDILAAEGLAKYETAGFLEDGKRVFFSMRVDDVHEIVKDDVIGTYLMGHSGHDGATAFTVMGTNIRPVCANTVGMALGSFRNQKKVGNYGWRIRHSSKMDEKIAAAIDGVRKVKERAAQYADDCRFLAGVNMSYENTKDYAEQVVAKSFGDDFLNAAIEETVKIRHQKEIVSDIAGRYHGEAQTLPGVAGTAWAAFNCVTEYTNWGMKNRGKNDLDRAENQFNSLFGGKAEKVNEIAWNTLWERVLA